MKIVTDKEEIRSIHERFANALDQYKTEELDIKTGFQGGSLQLKGKYSKELDIWWAFRMKEGNSGWKYWNGFGIGRPIEGKGASMVVQLNYPEEGINKQIAGAWLKDGNDTVLIHTGKIGGGKSGVGRDAFRRMYSGNEIELDLVNFKGNYIEIGSLNNPRLVYQIKHFVEEVSRFKNFATGVNMICEVIEVLISKRCVTCNRSFKMYRSFCWSLAILRFLDSSTFFKLLTTNP